MNAKEWQLLSIGLVCLLVMGCTMDTVSTPSGSDLWSRGVILDATEVETVAVAAGEDATFVVWVGEEGQLRMAQLDVALTQENITDLDLHLASAYAGDLDLQVGPDGQLHLTWEDILNGVPTLVYARLLPGQAVPAFRRDFPLSGDAHHIATLMRLEAERLEILWSAISGWNSGIYHLGADLAGEVVAPPVQLTETGRQPGLGRGPDGTLHLAWADDAVGTYISIWHAYFDPEGQSLADAAAVATAFSKRGGVFHGPAVGAAGRRVLVAWSTGSRGVILGRGDVYTGGLLGGWASPFGGAAAPTAPTPSYGDRAEYVIISAGEEEANLLAMGEVVGAWEAPQAETMGEQTWVAFSGLIKRRNSVLSQVVLASFDAAGRGDLVPVTATSRHSLWPDLAIAPDGTLRVAWLEMQPGEGYQVVLASAVPEARDAWGRFRWGEWWAGVVAVIVEALAMSLYAPLVLGWVALPVVVVVVVSFVSRDFPRGRIAVIWLAASVVLHLLGKRLIAAPLVSFTDPLQVTVMLATIGVGAWWMRSYWRRADEPSLLAAYARFALLDGLLTLFVLLPQVLWAG